MLSEFVAKMFLQPRYSTRATEFQNTSHMCCCFTCCSSLLQKSSGVALYSLVHNVCTSGKNVNVVHGC